LNISTPEDIEPRYCPKGHRLRGSYCVEMQCPHNGYDAHSGQPVADPTETLALMAEHRLTVGPRTEAGPGWCANAPVGLLAVGHTIGDAVRACVARIKEAK
jgi:hypothetical protein